MRWLTDGRGLVLLLALFATSPVAAVLGQGVDSAAPGTAALNNVNSADGAVAKYVLKGPNGAFHLIGEGGTAHYRAKCGHHAGCCCRVAYLVRLELFEVDKDFLYYNPIDGDPEAGYLAIRHHSSFCRHYAIWRGTRHGREFLGYFRLEIPN
jgi:hypothetical protein